MSVISIDGSQGGGQVLRTALGLSIVTQTPFKMFGIRGKRPKPGLMRQHLTSVQAAQAVCDARVEGAEIGSQAITFKPGAAKSGDYAFAIGTAGSTTLVLQTVLFGLALAGGKSRVVLEGGTHNPLSPPFEFLRKAFLPLLARMGMRAEVTLDRAGFYPAGGGRIVATIEPCDRLQPLSLIAAPSPTLRATALVSNLPRDIGDRELGVLREKLTLASDEVVQLNRATGPGNAVWVEAESAELTEVFTGFGEKRVRAEEVAARVAHEVRAYLDARVPVGEYLADQLLMPLALAGGGAFKTLPLSEHSRTQIETLALFLPARFNVTDGVVEVR